jgi:hypothetical protein
MREESNKQDKESLERDWVAKHRSEYAGQWIAVDGDELISHSTDPKQVFMAARSAGKNPLIIQIERKEPPFGGW